MGRGGTLQRYTGPCNADLCDVHEADVRGFVRVTFPRLSSRLSTLTQYIDFVRTLLTALSAAGVSIGRSAVPG